MKTLLIVGAEVVPGAVLVGAVGYERWRRKRAGERPPQTDKLLREPGHTLRRQLEDKLDNFTMWLFVAVVGGLTCGWTLAFDVRGDLGGFLVGALTGAVGIVMGWLDITKADPCHAASPKKLHMIVDVLPSAISARGRPRLATHCRRSRGIIQCDAGRSGPPAQGVRTR